uniref:AlNc14C16G1740 protein n=1 Tax=Albugo laibachii Nc14 TaxID=890382 RepID=F0W457_9STRA|nr:AlNc14C16G1740 [Albugo laibachii Nc14]|eukprot:CCA15855.1 AlNc14C16G1740 [Albugo laibachii Nc14]
MPTTSLEMVENEVRVPGSGGKNAGSPDTIGKNHDEIGPGSGKGIKASIRQRKLAKWKLATNSQKFFKNIR